jgi:succinoglycan biosynthesis transport protein ExoP
LITGITFAFLLEYLNNSIQTPADVKQYLDIPCLAVIPKISIKHLAPHEQQQAAKDTLIATITLVDPKSMIAEAYRNLRTSVVFAAFDQKKIFLVTSATPGEGKSTITANLGILMAQSGKKTLIIDCDLRKPRISEIFHLKQKEYGLSDILIAPDSDDIGAALQPTDIDNLSIIPCGTIPPNPSELLGLDKTGRIIAKLSEQYEKILIDSPPVGVVSDALLLSPFVQGVILVILTGKTTRDSVQYARDQLHETRANILGGVLNNVDIKKHGYYYSSYYYAHKHKYYQKYYGEKKK